MPRTIPIALQSHLNQDATTVCLLVRIVPTDDSLQTFGVTSLDRDIEFDGETYHAATGLDNSARVTAGDMSVDNSEGISLVPEFEIPVSERDLVAGVYDYAKWYCYLVNYEDLSQFVELSRGEIGQVRVRDGLSFTFEMLGLTKKLKQTIVEKDSLRCRAKFGSQYPGTVGDGVITERFPCGFPLDQLDALNVNGSVTAVSVESTVQFMTNLGQGDNFFKPGMLEWVTGDNQRRIYEVEEYQSSEVVLTFPTMFPVKVGDTFRIRPDCTKWSEGQNGCKQWWSGDWVLHYRGERWIPVGDTGQINAPGASV